MKSEDLLKFAGLCGILVPIIAITSISLAISYAPWFRLDYHCLSDLGVKGNSAFIFNYGLIISGILAIIFGILLTKVLPAGKPSIVGTIIFILASIAFAGVGLFPMTAGDAHLISSISFFILAALAILIIGIAMIKKNQFIGTFLIILAFIVPITFFIPWPGMSCAIAEIIAIIPVIIFTTVFGVFMISNKQYKV